ncbi:pectin lyase fold/virulence factor [Auriculariales sp. MPI-PUGE-AT-0066]|nr:pectin lyase fold/virulence factor [Auriculariales sp. MPI-PUGE-AT-0066]
MTLKTTLLAATACLAFGASVVATASPTLCTVKSSGGDDAPALIAALQSCPKVTVPKDTVLSIRSPMNTTDLSNVHLSLEGTLKYYDDVDYWATNSFPFEFQATYTFWMLGGKDILVDGGGTIDGSGETWWQAWTINSTVVRPIPLTIFKGKRVVVANISMIQPPNWFNLIHTSQDVLFTNVKLTAQATTVTPKNTDGWDTYRSDRVVIQDSVINNTDDCVSFKPNSTNILVRNLICNGSHGISVGSLGQYPQYVDIVENIMIKNVSLSNVSNAARIKVWAGPNVGSGRVNNVTWDGIPVTNADQAITFDQCYFNVSDELCKEYPSRVNISNILLRGVAGTSSGKLKALTASIKCSPGAVCSNIVVDDFNVTPPSQYGAATTICENLTICGSSALQFNCTGTGSGQACS